MQSARGKRVMRKLARDWALGVAVFIALLAGMSGGSGSWTSAAASDEALANGIEATYLPNAGSEDAANAVLFRPAVGPKPERGRTLILLGLTFSLMFAFNLTIWRHLRRVYASPRREVWRSSR